MSLGQYHNLAGDVACAAGLECRANLGEGKGSRDRDAEPSLLDEFDDSTKTVAEVAAPTVDMNLDAGVSGVEGSSEWKCDGGYPFR